MNSDDSSLGRDSDLPGSSAAPPDAPGTSDSLVAGRYRLGKVLGQGAFGKTYAAVRVDTGAPVAVKQLSLAHVEDWKSVELFEREARTLASLDHPSIPAYVEFLPVHSERSGYLVQALAPGHSLAEYLSRGRVFSEPECIDIGRQVLDILVYLGRRAPPVVHRDIKPANLIMDDDGRIKLVDFGAVQNAAKRQKGGSTIVGTFGYMAPEQFQGMASPASDLYGLGMTLVHLLTGVDPTDMERTRLRVDFRAYTRVSPSFEFLLERLIAPVPEDRFESAAQAAQAASDSRPLAVLNAAAPEAASKTSARRGGPMRGSPSRPTGEPTTRPASEPTTRPATGPATGPGPTTGPMSEVEALIRARDAKKEEARRRAELALQARRAVIARKRRTIPCAVTVDRETDGVRLRYDLPLARRLDEFGLAWVIGGVVLSVVGLTGVGWVIIDWPFIAIAVNVLIWGGMAAIGGLVLLASTLSGIREQNFHILASDDGNFAVYRRGVGKPRAFGRLPELQLRVNRPGLDDALGTVYVSAGSFAQNASATDEEIDAFERFQRVTGASE